MMARGVSMTPTLPSFFPEQPPCYSPFSSFSSSTSPHFLIALARPLNLHYSSLPSSHPPSPPIQPIPPTTTKAWRRGVSNSRRVVPFRTLIALSAAAAAFFLKRKKIFKPFKESQAMAGSRGVSSFKKFDCHLHVWASPEEMKEYPYFPGQETTLLGSCNDLLKCMEEAGVDGALIVQPINHMFDHSYVTSVLQKHPDKFVGCLLADPCESGDGVTKMEHLVTKEGYKAVRFNPYLWPSNEKMNNKIGKRMFVKAGELGIAVGFMCFKGLLLHVAEIEDLCSQNPSTIVMIDHFGFCKPPLNEVEEESLSRLLQLARFPKVYVKVSAFFRVSRGNFPYRDIWPVLKKLLSSFGAKRLMWGRGE